MKLVVEEWHVIILVCTVIILAPLPRCHAGRLNTLEGAIYGTMNGVGDGVDTRRLYQRYHLQATHDPTDTMQLMWDINYTRNWSSKSPLQETITPNLIYTLTNDIFVWDNNFLYSKTHSDDGRDLITRSWQTNYNSVITHRFLPQFSANFGQNWSSDGKEPHEDDTLNSFGGVNLSYSLDPFSFDYNFYRTVTDDRVADTTSTTNSHFAKAEFNRSFWQDRLRLGLSHQVSKNISKFRADTTPGTEIEAKVYLYEVMVDKDDTPEEGKLSIETRLNDGDLKTRVFSIKYEDAVNIGLNTNFQRIDRLFVYVDPDPREAITSSEASQTSWDLYSSADGEHWTRQKTNIPYTYDDVEKRFEFEVASDVKALYLKLVITSWPELKEIGLTELEAYRIFKPEGTNVSDESKFTQRITNLNITGKPSERTSFNYSFVYEKDDASSGISQKNLTQAGSFLYDYSRYFSPNFSINDSIVEPSEGNKTETRSFAVTVISRPLDTMNVSLGVTRNESFTDDELKTVSHDVNLLATATLYPDLTSSMDLIYSRNKNRDSGRLAESYQSRLSFTARLRKSITADLYTDYHIMKSQRTNEGGRTTLTFNWRPSDILSIIFDATRGYGDQSETKTINLNVSASLIRTRSSQLTLTYLFQKSEDLMQNINVNWSWDISEFFTLNTSTSIQMGKEEDRWNVQANLSARF